MSPTDATRWDELACELFDEVIVPVAERRRAQPELAGIPLGRDDAATTYFVEPGCPSMSGSDFETSWGDADGLVDALIARWHDAGRSDLASMGPWLREIARLLSLEPDERDASVDVLCYTLF